MINNKIFSDHSSDEEDQNESFAEIIKGPLRKKFYLALIELEHQVNNSFH